MGMGVENVVYSSITNLFEFDLLHFPLYPNLFIFIVLPPAKLGIKIKHIHKNSQIRIADIPIHSIRHYAQVSTSTI
jgi:hypothetical protein